MFYLCSAFQAFPEIVTIDLERAELALPVTIDLERAELALPNEDFVSNTCSSLNCRGHKLNYLIVGQQLYKQLFGTAGNGGFSQARLHSESDQCHLEPIDRLAPIPPTPHVEGIALSAGFVFMISATL